VATEFSLSDFGAGIFSGMNDAASNARWVVSIRDGHAGPIGRFHSPEADREAAIAHARRANPGAIILDAVEIPRAEQRKMAQASEDVEPTRRLRRSGFAITTPGYVFAIAVMLGALPGLLAGALVLIDGVGRESFQRSVLGAAIAFGSFAVICFAVMISETCRAIQAMQQDQRAVLEELRKSE
jgi:hypothetical protein